MATTARDVTKAIATIPGRMAPTATSALLRLADIAIDGYGSVPGAKATAAAALQRRGDVDKAIDSVVHSHVAMASAQGFATNIGGLLTAVVTAPANITGVVVLQTRMVASIAHLRGYDVADPRVRTAVLMCLLGEDELRRQIDLGKLPSTPLAVATAPVTDFSLNQRVGERVLTDVLGDVGSKRLTTLLGRGIPLVGGGVGAVFDGFATHTISRCAKTHLVSRRQR